MRKTEGFELPRNAHVPEQAPHFYTFREIKDDLRLKNHVQATLAQEAFKEKFRDHDEKTRQRHSLKEWIGDPDDMHGTLTASFREFLDAFPEETVNVSDPASMTRLLDEVLKFHRDRTQMH